MQLAIRYAYIGDMTNTHMKALSTLKIGNALRKHGLTQYAVLEYQHRREGTDPLLQPFFLGRPTKEQHGWTLTKGAGFISINHSEMNRCGEWEFSHVERTTTRFQEWSEWVETIVASMKATGFAVELISAEFRFGHMKQHKTQITKEIKIIAQREEVK